MLGYVSCWAIVWGGKYGTLSRIRRERLRDHYGKTTLHSCFRQVTGTYQVVATCSYNNSPLSSHLPCRTVQQQSLEFLFTLFMAPSLTFHFLVVYVFLPHTPCAENPAESQTVCSGVSCLCPAMASALGSQSLLFFCRRTELYEFEYVEESSGKHH